MSLYLFSKPRMNNPSSLPFFFVHQSMFVLFILWEYIYVRITFYNIRSYVIGCW